MKREAQAMLLVLLGAILLKLVVTGGHLNYVKAGLGPFVAISAAILVVLGFAGVFAGGGDDDHHDHHEEHAAAPAEEGPRSRAVRRAAERRAKEERRPGLLARFRRRAAASAERDAAGNSAVRAAHLQHDAGHGHGDDGGHGHDHTHGPRVAWLLLLPVAALLLVAPPALGAFSAARDTGSVDFERRVDTSEALESGDGPLKMTLLEYGGRSIVEEGEGLEGRQVELIGFVGADKGAEGLVLTRMTMACCAADGQAIKVFTDTPTDLPPDTWVKVVGTYAEPVERGKALWPSLTVESVTEIAQPENPYI